MTPATFKSIRQRAGLTQSGVAAFLRLSGETGGRHVRKLESGDAPISGPVAFLMELLDAGVIQP
jgi:DNA-binding transcriptional regulator YiaG